MDWYQGELLNMALDVGYRLLPAFNSSTGNASLKFFEDPRHNIFKSHTLITLKISIHIP